MQNLSFYILNIVIASFTLFLLFIYIKSSSFKSIPFYFNILFCFIITADNALRLIPVEDTKDTINNPTLWCKIQGFSIAFFDKLFISSITIYSFMNYLIMIHIEFYEKRSTIFYYLLTLIYILSSLVLTYLDYLEGMSSSSLKHNFCYIKTESFIKEITDNIYMGILFIIDLFCVIRTIFRIRWLIKKREKENQNNRIKNLKRHFWRFIFHLFLNIVIFTFLFLLVNKKLPKLSVSIRDYVYVLLCLIAELFFTINIEFLRESMRILTCNKRDRFTNKNDEMELLSSESVKNNNEEKEFEIS